jgi:beta-lactamase class A
MINRTILTLLLLFLSACSHRSDINSLPKYIQKLEKQSSSIIGVHAIHIENGKSFGYKDNEHFPMASTVKVPIAVYLMHLAEKKKINLDKMVTIKPNDLVLGSGIMEFVLSRPGLAISIYNMFEPMMAISDNSATDIILKQIGGPKAVYKFLQQNDLSDIIISRSLQQIYSDSSGLKSWPDDTALTLKTRRILLDQIDDATKIEAYGVFYNDIRDTATPLSMATLLTKLHKKELLNAEYSKMLLDVMEKAAYSHLKKLLPKDVKIASKTGTWWDDKSSGKKYHYTNEVAIITLPDNHGHLAMAIYIKSDNSSTKLQKNAMSKIGLMLYNNMSGKE